MPKDLRHQIEHHLATFPERHEDMLELKKEWGEFKKEDSATKQKAFWVLIGFVGVFIGIGVWVGSIESSIHQLVSEHEKENEQRDRIESRVGVLEINNGEIRTRLTAIEVTLQEIKAAIIKLQ